MSGALYVTSTQLNAQYYLQQHTVARWVAENALTQIRLQPGRLSGASQSGYVEQMGERWFWKALVTPAGQTSLKRIEVSVFKGSKATGSSVYQLTGFDR